MSQSLVSGTLVSITLVLHLASSQSIPGASFFGGNGAPGVAPYQLVDDYSGSIFFNKFNFYSSYDPTYGHVQYVNSTVATQNGYASITNANTAKIVPDTTNRWPRGGKGRPSVRIISDNTYTHGLFIFDAVHMPWGCGTWPAYWLLGPNWPSNGEIDIIEGVNTQTLNDVSLHASPGCSVAGSGQTGTLQTTNCDTSQNGNSGCGTQLNNTATPNNYGSGFNANGGGVYATEWTSNYIKTWFFPRGSIPPSVTSQNPDPSTFGVPAANHQGSCNIDQHFANHSIIINTDFCGAWAGQVYSQFSQCPQTVNASSLDSCVDFVGNNPSNFTSAYWEINYLRVYQMPATAVASSTYTTSLSSAPGVASSNTINQGMGQSTSVSSAPYTGPVSSATASAAASTATPVICPGSNQTTWTDYNNQPYNIGCGYDYNGGTTGIANAIVQTNSFEACLEQCDVTSQCLAVAYVGGNGAGNCYLKSQSGSFVMSGSVNAAVRVNGPVVSVSTSMAPTMTSTSTATVPASTIPPFCPDWNGKIFADNGNVNYTVGCYQNYAGGNIGSPQSFASISACMPSCDNMSGCTGVTFDLSKNFCQLKSSFSGTSSTNNTMIAAQKKVVVSSVSTSTATVSTSVTGNVYGYGGMQGYGGYGYGGVQFTTRTPSTSPSKTSTKSTTSLSSQTQTTTSLSSSVLQSSSSLIQSMSSSALVSTTMTTTATSSTMGGTTSSGMTTSPVMTPISSGMSISTFAAPSTTQYNTTTQTLSAMPGVPSVQSISLQNTSLSNSVQSSSFMLPLSSTQSMSSQLQFSSISQYSTSISSSFSSTQIVPNSTTSSMMSQSSISQNSSAQSISQPTQGSSSAVPMTSSSMQQSFAASITTQQTTTSIGATSSASQTTSVLSIALQSPWSQSSLVSSGLPSSSFQSMPSSILQSSSSRVSTTSTISSQATAVLTTMSTPTQLKTVNQSQTNTQMISAQTATQTLNPQTTSSISRPSSSPSTSTQTIPQGYNGSSNLPQGIQSTVSSAFPSSSTSTLTSPVISPSTQIVSSSLPPSSSLSNSTALQYISTVVTSTMSTLLSSSFSTSSSHLAYTQMLSTTTGSSTSSMSQQSSIRLMSSLSQVVTSTSSSTQQGTPSVQTPQSAVSSSFALSSSLFQSTVATSALLPTVPSLATMAPTVQSVQIGSLQALSSSTQVQDLKPSSLLASTMMYTITSQASSSPRSPGTIFTQVTNSANMPSVGTLPLSQMLFSSLMSSVSQSSQTVSTQSTTSNTMNPNQFGTQSVSQYASSVQALSTSQSSTILVATTSGATTSPVLNPSPSAYTSSLISPFSTTNTATGQALSLSFTTPSSMKSASMTTSSMSLASSVAPCPTDTMGYCGSNPSSMQQTTCADNSGAIYAVSCGTLYYGDVIDTSSVYGRDLVERAHTPNIGACQALCSRYVNCVAFNFVNNNCALLDRVDGSVASSSAVAGMVVVTPAASSSPAPPPPDPYANNGATSSSTTVMSQVTVTTYVSGPPTVTLTATTTTNAPNDGYYTTGPSGSYYVYSSSASMTNASVTLCFNCGLTPTVVYSMTSPPNVTTAGCMSTRSGTVTVFTTSTVTTCDPQPTCPAPGYGIIGGGASHPGQQVVTSTGNSGQVLTYTQVPTGSNGGNSGSASLGQGTPVSTSGMTMSSGVLPIGSTEPQCPGADNTIITDSYGMRYRFHCDIEYTDRTLDTQTQNSMSACLASCDLYNIKNFYAGTVCFGVGFLTDQTTNNCLLKAGTTPFYRRNCESCQLLTPNQYNTTSATTVVSVSPSPFTTVVGGSVVVSTYTTTLPASTVTVYSTIYTNGAYTGTPVGVSTVPASTLTSTTTVTVGGTTIVTQGPGYYGNGGGGGGSPATVTVTPSANNGGGVVSTVYVVSTATTTYVTNGQTIVSTYGVTTVASTVYLPGTTQTVTTTTVSILVTKSVQYVPTTIVTTAAGGTTTIVTSYPVTYTKMVSGGGGSGGNGGGTVTVTQGGGSGGNGGGTVIVTANNGGGAGTVTLTTGNGGGGNGGGTVTVTAGNSGSGNGGGTVTVTQGGSNGGTATATQSAGAAATVTLSGNGGGTATVTQAGATVTTGGGQVTVTAAGGSGGNGGQNITVTASGQGVTVTASGAGGSGGGTVTVTQNTGNGAGSTVFVTNTVTQTNVPSSSSSSFTCRTYGTNYLNGLHGRSEPTSMPRPMLEAVDGILVETIGPVPARGERQSVFQKKIILDAVDRMAQGPKNLLTGEFDYWFID